MKTPKRPAKRTRRLVMPELPKKQVLSALASIPDPDINDGYHAVKGRRGFLTVPEDRQKSYVVTTNITRAEKVVLVKIAKEQNARPSQVLRAALRQYLQDPEVKQIIQDSLDADNQYTMLFE